MKKILLLFLFFCNILSASSQKYFQQQVNYIINATLNDVENTLDGNIKIDYTNNSPDTLFYIWFHLWPNAYKNDKTAFSEQLLKIGRTDFYFSDEKKRGYISRLDFKVNEIIAKLEDHSQYIDVVKLILPKPLLPAQTIKIGTPFHVKIPFNFSRGGYVDQTYQITQWYPKPAVYDRKGWHPMPYLDQGEFYSEFGNFDVQITLPKNYVVAATGDLQNEDEKKWLRDSVPKVYKGKILTASHQIKTSAKKNSTPEAKKTKQSVSYFKKNPSNSKNNKDEIAETKTLHYIQNDVHDFAWFADKSYTVDIDTLRLSSGKIINIYSYYNPSSAKVWGNSTQFIKDAITTRSAWLGEYPYNIVTALEAKMGFAGGMEYPTITSISPTTSEKELELTIEHEVGHNWNYGILATNERQHPWMDEGMNSFFDNRYVKLKAAKKTTAKKRLLNLEPEDPEKLNYKTAISLKTDQPIETASEDFSETNYYLTAYYKAAQWMQLLENYLGKQLFDKAMHEYYERWKFKHPYPEDFKKVITDVSGKNADAIFSLLNKKGDLQSHTKNKPVKLIAGFSFNESDKYNYVFISPIAGFNYYDKLMPGLIVHNYTLPVNKFQFLATPMYATGSKKLAGLARLEYNWRSYGMLQNVKLSLSAASFSNNTFIDSVGNKTYLGFKKIVPSLKIIFREKDPRSNIHNYLQWKTYFINEDGVQFSRDTVRNIDIINYSKTTRYLNELKFYVANSRALYPYNAEIKVEQGNSFARASLTGNYFLNYRKGGGLDVRFFAGKFFYLGDKTFLKQFETDAYHLTMTGPKGYEDYTYSNYFAGRNEYEGSSAKQIMIRDGAFKVRTDLLASKVGKTDNWLVSANFKTDFPEKINPLNILPIKIPLKLFFDVGTYAEAWKKDAATGKFLYDGGLQVSLINDLINIYLPLVYSKVYIEYFKSTTTGNLFFKNISFSINLQHFNFKKIYNQIPF